jgi:arylsulfatase A-like enzyme
MASIPWRALFACMCLSGCALGVTDLALAGYGFDPRDYLAVLALGATAGAVSACGWGLLLRLGVWPGPWLLALGWALVGLALGAELADALGVFSRLGGRNWQLALGVLAGALLCGLGVALLGLLHQPRAGRPRGLIGSLGLRVRALWAFGLCAALVVGAEVDRSVETDGYVPAHLALRVLGHWLLGFACLALAPAPNAGDARGMFSAGDARGRLRARVFAVVSLVGLLVGLAGLEGANGPRLHRILGRPYPALYLTALRALVDVDRDGYASLFGGGDCAPFDSRVNPGAQELPNNGRDDNCRLGDLRRVARPPGLPPQPKTAAPLSVVLITIDSLRADHLGSYGYAKPTSRRLDAWAKGALRFDRAYTTGGWTTLALSSMFRGLYPRKLAWTWLIETTRYRLLRTRPTPRLHPGEKPRKVFMMPLEDPHPSLSHLLMRRGMHTAAVVDDSYTYVLAPGVGGFRHFHDYVEIDRGSSPSRRSRDDATTREALRMLRKLHRAKQPFFLWVHYFGTHMPSEQHRGVPKFGTGTAAEYDHEVAYLDQKLEPLLGKLDALAVQKPLAVFVTADHGETLSARGRGHGMNLEEGSIRIPLFAKAPGLQAGVRTEPVSLVDLMPTLLALTETPAPAEMDGVDLLAPGPRPARVLLTDTWRIDDEGEFYKDLVGAFDGRLKLGFDRLHQDQHLSRQDDPEERDLLESRDAPALRRALDAYLEAHGALVLRR